MTNTDYYAEIADGLRFTIISIIEGENWLKIIIVRNKDLEKHLLFFLCPN